MSWRSSARPGVGRYSTGAAKPLHGIVPRMPRDKVGPYRVERQLGSGGMGEVLLAFDDRLQRHVAIKKLHLAMFSAPDLRERFRREAQAVAKLNHSSIVQIHDIVVEDDTEHIVMEYVEGKTLASLVAAGPLPVGKVIRIAREVCAGLVEAHSKGIAHRDLKAENVVITPTGQAKILDFGLAKRLWDTEFNPSQTAPGAVFGTFRAMSPEQAQGREVDHRSDLFSFGVLLYEALTGKSPFHGSSGLSLLAQVISQRQPPAKSLVPEIPDELSDWIDRLLEKAPERRPQTAIEVAIALERLAERYPASSTAGLAPLSPSLSTSSLSPSPSAGRAGFRGDSSVELVFDPFSSSTAHPTTSGQGRSIAVLPFANLSADAENEYFSDGLTEDLASVLAQIPGLRVASHTSSLAFKGKSPSVQEVGTALNVESVLTGSVRKAGVRLRITARLTHVRDGFEAWSERYDRELNDVFALQDEIARTIAETLRLELAGDGRAARVRSAPDGEAYNAYLKGRYHWSRRFAGGLRKGMEYFQQAIAADPAFAPPYTGLADSFAILAFYNYVAPGDGFPKALAAARQALALDESLAEAHASLALVMSFYEWDWKTAEREFQRAIGLNPGWGTAYAWYSVHLFALGHPEASRRAIEKAMRVEPLSASIGGAASFSMFLQGDHDRGIRLAKEALETDPSFAAGYAFLGWNLLGKEAWGEATSVLETAVERMGDPSLVKAMLGFCHARSGDEAKARAVLAELLGRAETSYVSSFFVALLYLALEERDKVFEWLDKAFDERNNWLAFLESLPTLAPLRSDPRMRVLSTRVGLDRAYGR